VIHWAKKHELATSIPLEDLVQEGILGLFRAIDKYDPERGFRFSTYATWWINQSISRAIQNTGRTVRVPSHMFGRLRKLKRKRRRLANRLQRFPDEVELARELGWDISDVCLLLHVERDTKSLDQSSDDSGKNGFGWRLRSPIKSPDATAEQMELQRIISKVLKTLDERSRHILILRYGLNGRRPRTLEQVGEKYGVTRERIRQIEKRALEKISSGPRGALLREYADIEESME
jgi:RNA polymerase nonessential primary-like sigma factor